LWRGAGSQSNATSHVLRPSFVRSDISIHLAIWPQQICAENWGALPLEGGGSRSPSHTVCSGPKAYLHAKTDNGPIAQGEAFYRRTPKYQKMVAMATSLRCSVSGNICLLSADHAYPVHNQLPSCYRSHMSVNSRFSPKIGIATATSLNTSGPHLTYDFYGPSSPQLKWHLAVFA